MDAAAALVQHVLSGLRIFGRLLLGVLTSRSLVIISTVCAVMYAGLWVAATLQANGLISTALPVAVSDRIVLLRGGGPMRQAAVSPDELAKRGKALAGASTAPGASGAVAGAQVPPMTLEVQTDAPVELWVTDERGGQLGTDPQTGLVRLQIAGASYSGHGVRPQLVSIPNAFGKYDIKVLGDSNAQYQLSVRLFAANDVDQATEYSSTGQIFADTLLETTAGVSADADGKPQLEVSALTVVVAGAAPTPAASAPPSLSPEPSAAVAAAEVGGPSPEPSAVAAAATGRPKVVAKPRAPVVVRPAPPPSLPVPLPVPNLAPAVTSPSPNP